MTEIRHNFTAAMHRHGLGLLPTRLETLQLNLTKLCNQACLHCHVDSSPRRREMMTAAVIDQCLAILEAEPQIKNLDLTGGAPELHPEFKALVRRARQLRRHVIVRHNLTVTHDPHPMTKASMAYLPDFFVEQTVEVISSLPYYQEFFTDKQRGSGVFQKSIKSLKLLNERGYGQPGSGLTLNLVYNPVGPFLPAAQASLEADYKRELAQRFDIHFNHLFTITNMPIHRFKFQLIKAGTYEDYMEKLMQSFNPVAAQGIMCRSLLSVAHDGGLFDCDFNQMLDMPITGSHDDKVPMTIFDFDAAVLSRRIIKVASHCFGCTAGAGSSCGGATV